MQISMSLLRTRGETMMVLIWIGISVAAVVLELITPTALISIWFAVGGVIGILLALLDLPLWLQIVAFAIVSIVSMLVVRPMASRYLRGNTVATNSDRCIGEIGVVVKQIGEDTWGEVKVNGTIWSAVSVDHDVIDEHDNVKVIAIEGAKLLVRKVVSHK